MEDNSVSGKIELLSLNFQSAFENEMNFQKTPWLNMVRLKRPASTSIIKVKKTMNLFTK